ncbi:uncharacterized protein alms1 [Girardinichthys multiradiatus]|uniref:uncharacterized protein alms1 n=1 Tax=Girardinichthys multiradiatus TaxID=208333 RepID=UPI001FAE0BA0|nr:uncharacterized protein alms1 [Girardinichthys multiradiatus]
MELQERAAAPSFRQEDEDMNGPDVQTGTPEARSQSSVVQDQRRPKMETDGRELQRSQQEALQLEFQDSNLSPVLSLLPLTSALEHSITNYSFFHQGDPEFAPLRAFPDVSVVSERFHFPIHDSTSHSYEQSSLSQHPLAQATLLSEEGANGNCSPSRHNLSKEKKGKQEDMAHLFTRDAAVNTQGKLSRDGSKKMELETLSNLTEKNKREIHEDETFFLSKDIPAQQLLDLLQKEVGMQSSSSSAVSSQSQPSMKSTGFCPDQPRHTENCKGIMFERQGPPGEASPSQHQKRHKDISTITIGSRRTQPDDSSEELHRKLLSEVRRLNSLEVNKKPKGLTPTPHTFTPSHKRSQGKSSGKPLSAGSEWVHRKRDLWSSQNQRGSDGSYLGFLPQSQSTPGIFFAPMKFNVKTKLGHLSAIESNKEVLYQSSTGAHSADGRLPDTANQCAEEAQQASDKVRSLPSLNYLQKVDAWRTKQSSERAPLFEDLALDRRGVSPEKKGDEAGSNTLNQGLPQQALQQPSTNQDATQISSSAPSGASSPRRGEAVGGAPSALANKGSAAPPSASPFGRSQSLSSLSPVVMSADKLQQTNVGPENRTTQIQTDAHPPPSTAIQPSPLDSLGHFSDVSVDQELSSSQDSCTEIKVGPSVGTSSVVSLELDNYAPYWTFKHSTTSQSLPGSKELNIDERIPLYLQNLGIDQTPSKILTPFAPRGPIREPEFSPTDLCTIKGSSGTPSKSTQPSEGGSPHKGDFSRSSVLSVDSSISIPFSLDSLGPAASMSEQVRARTSLPSNSEASQREGRPVSCSQPDERSTILHPGQQQHDGRQDFIQIEDRFQPNWVAMKITGTERNLVLQSSHSLGQESENSFVSTRALSEIRKLLSQGENMISTGSSTASSGPNAASHFSDIDIFRPPTTKDSRLQSSSFSSFSSTGSDLKSQSSLPLARSSSESMLTSEKPKQSSAGQESLTTSWQPDNLSTQTVSIGPQDGAVSNSAGASLVMSKSARRAEPEGCSAAPPDKIPTQPSTAAVTQQLNATSTDGKGLPEEEEKATPRDPGAESRSSSPIPEDADQGVISGGSSESSLAVRVAKLLVNESPATVASSTPSVTDQEEGKAREWLKSKASGQHCEPLRLNLEDRRRIEEIKQELLLNHPMKSQGSTDTESSAASSVSVNKKNTPPKEAEAFSTLIDANKKLGLSMDHPDPQTQLQSILHLNLEAQVCEIAAREGVKLPSKRPQTLTSIIIPTHSHSVTSSPSMSPAPPLSPASDPLHLTELPAGTVKPTSTNKSLPTNQEEAERVPSAQTTREPPSVYDESTSNHIATSQKAPGNQKRQDTVGGQSEEPPLDKQDVIVRHINTTFRNQHEEIYTQTSSFSAVGHEAKQAFRTTHLPHVHFTLPPKASDHTSSSAVHHPGATLRDPSSAVSSPDEGVGSSSPAEWYDSRKPALDRSDASTVFKAPQGKGITASSQSFAQRHRSAASPRPFTAETPVPVLLPYKPRGSEELFYVPHTEADASSTNQSDTTMESSHTGSDDAVPPSFSSEVLGDQDPGLGRGVAIRHKEGIYSKRLKTASFRMQDPAHTDASAAAEKGSPALSQSPKSSSQVSDTFTRVPSINNPKASKRDQGTSPIQFLHYQPTELAHEKFHPAQEEVRERDLPLSSPQQSSNTLDHLWQKFYDQWSKEESRPASDKEASLLERLERLSHVIHHTQAAHGSDVQEGQGYYLSEQLGRRQRRKERWKVGGGREAEHPAQLRLQAEEPVFPAENDSIVSHSSSQNHPFSPADRDQPESLSTLSGSTSTVDTARLIRAFGADKVKHLNSSSSLSKLYSTINKQREVREHRRRTKVDSSVTLTPLETTGTDGSVVPDSASTPSTCTASPDRGPSRALTAKRAVRVVNKSIQAGELEIVHNGTRRHTRDVGTTFPSPGEARALEQISPPLSSTVGGRGGGWRVLPKSNNSQKQKKSKRSPPKPYPKGVSWFISADNLRSETRKENRPEESARRPNTAWFEPYSRVHPWREPLRQRQVHEDGSNRHFKTPPELDPNPKSKILPSGLAWVSLKEALEMRRPDFISRSKQRVRCLALQAEERRLQAVFRRERNLPFNQLWEPERLLKPAGTALLRRAVPRKEMIQRSKQIYENLPEVQRRREEEKRKAEYQSYRLNAQLYNKRITNLVLGRRAAWH